MAVTIDRTINVRLPQDRESQPIQVLAPAQATSVNSPVGGTTARLQIPTTSEIILITSTEDVWVKFGSSSVAISAAGETGSFLLLAGERALQTPTGMTHLAFIQRANAGVICLTNMN